MPFAAIRNSSFMPLALRKGGADGPGGGDDHQLDVDELESVDEEPVKIRCAGCEHELTDADARVSPDGAHRHVKVNPHGNVYHIACFSPVPGVIPIGKPSGEFSWFSGYRWQIAVCGGCQQHLGWRFVGDDGFVALIEGRFVAGG